MIKLNSTGIHKHLVIKLHSTGIHNTVSCDQFYSSTDIKVAVSRDFLAFFAQKVRPEPHMNRQKWFRKLFHFRKKYSNFKFEKFEFFWQASPLKSQQQMLGYIEVVPIKKNLYQGEKWPAQTKLMSAKLCAKLANFEFPQIFRKINMWWCGA